MREITTTAELLQLLLKFVIYRLLYLLITVRPKTNKRDIDNSTRAYTKSMRKISSGRTTSSHFTRNQ